jgi:hypothetical protein
MTVAQPNYVSEKANRGGLKEERASVLKNLFHERPVRLCGGPRLEDLTNSHGRWCLLPRQAH